MDQGFIDEILSHVLPQHFVGRVAHAFEHRRADHRDAALAVHAGVDVLKVLEDAPKFLLTLTSRYFGAFAVGDVAGNTRYLLDQPTRQQNRV